VRILLDECLPRRLKRDLVGHQAQTVTEMGWATSKTNGELLALAESDFDVFLTVDRNLSFQQEITRFNVAVVVGSAGCPRRRCAGSVGQRRGLTVCGPRGARALRASTCLGAGLQPVCGRRRRMIGRRWWSMTGRRLARASGHPHRPD
jgi:hypothetical protein